MEKDTIYFNSWSENYKKPFGAVRSGQTVDFSITVHLDGIRSVQLIIGKDGGNDRAVAMTKVDDWLYRCIYPCGESGLYFYCFRIRYRDAGGEHQIGYGMAEDGFGGSGKASANSDVRRYQLTCAAGRDPAPGWYLRGVIYHIFVDRFYNGNRDGRVDHPKRNSFIYATREDVPYYIRNPDGGIDRWDFFGGNLQGIVKKLRYLRDLGVTILYLSPIFESESNHKYDTADFRRIDPMFGDRKTFRRLIARARHFGMKIILDGVFNHVGASSIYFNRRQHYGAGGAFNDRNSVYFPWFHFHHYPDRYACWWGIDDLPEVDKNNASYRDFIYRAPDSVIHRWTSEGIGGWRLDVADELPDDFIAGIRRALEKHAADGGKVLIGEVWEDASNKTAYGRRRHYLEGGMLHGVMNYPFRQLIIDLILGKITARHAARAGLTLKSNYPRDAFMASMNNIGTHDTERIVSVLGGDERKVAMAAALLMTLPGVPCIYYGDEAGLSGGKDPDNRRYFPWGRENHSIQTAFRRAIHRRRADICLQEGDFLPFSAGLLFCFFRLKSDSHFTLLLFNPTNRAQPFDRGQVVDEAEDARIPRALNRVSTGALVIDPFGWKILHSDEDSKKI
ncbi:MAG: glycoside hydrolase family 13 protein [Sporolactobacillus sp.]|nr:glycoside hydrolase family 13 protein [Sporolactobacillus sp.]